jgi:hypothetical protein
VGGRRRGRLTFRVGRSAAVDDWQAGVAPGLEAAVDVGDVGATEIEKIRGRKAGGVALLAEHDDRGGLCDVLDTCGEGRIEPPLEDVAFDHDAAGDLALNPSLIARADVDEKVTTRMPARRGRRLDPGKPCTGRCQPRVDP